MTTSLDQKGPGMQNLDPTKPSPVTAAMLAMIATATKEDLASVGLEINRKMNDCPWWCGRVNDHDPEFEDDAHDIIVGKVDGVGEVWIAQVVREHGAPVQRPIGVNLELLSGVTGYGLTPQQSDALGELLTRAASHITGRMS